MFVDGALYDFKFNGESHRGVFINNGKNQENGSFHAGGKLICSVKDAQQVAGMTKSSEATPLSQQQVVEQIQGFNR